MSSRWSEEDGDEARLPEGFKRIGYDADTQRYTFRDASGVIYEGESGVRYGVMTPISSPVDVVKRTRPSAFARSPLRSSTLPANLEKAPKTFQEFLPAELITTSTISESSEPKTTKSSKPLGAVDLVRRSTMPTKVQGVVHSLRRSIRRTRLRPLPLEGEGGNEGEDESRGLVRRRASTVSSTPSNSNSDSASVLDPSPSVSTTRTDNRSQHLVIPVNPLRQT